jgi:hypothetical protein
LPLTLDLEPEYVAISPDSSTAWVVLQENNAMAIIDLGSTPALDDVVALGTKDFSLPGNEIDASNKDGILHNLQTWPVQSYYPPDAIASFSVGGATFCITANEGDARDYDGFSEEARVKDMILELAVFTTAGLQDDDQLGRLTITWVLLGDYWSTAGTGGSVTVHGDPVDGLEIPDSVRFHVFLLPRYPARPDAALS